MAPKLSRSWEAARLLVEVDGFWPTEAAAWWADMSRDNEFTVSGYRVLRFPAFAVRTEPDRVARQIQAALRLGPLAAAAPPPRASGGSRGVSPPDRLGKLAAP